MLSFLKRNFYVIGIIYALMALAIFPKWTIDDAFITYRYSQNLADHGQLTWNAGEDPVEGYTGVFLPVVVALFMKLGISPIATGKIIGVLSYFLGGLLLALSLKKLGVVDLARSLVLLLYFTAPFSFSHAWAGLETMLYSAALLACSYLLLIIVTAPTPRPSTEAWLMGALLFAGLVRPEAALLGGIFSLVLVYVKRVGPKGEWRGFILRFLCLYALPGLIYFLWRWQYYGQLFPNPFYAKSSPGLLDKGSVLGLAFFMLYYLVIPFLLCLLLYLTNPRSINQRLSSHYFGRSRAGLGIALLSVLAFVAMVYLQYLGSRLLINFEFRFFAQYYPLILLLGGAFLGAAFDALQGKKHLVVTLLVVLLVATQLVVNFNQFNKYRSRRGEYINMLAQEHIPAGLFVRDQVPPEDWLIVVHDAGATPFYSRLKTMDFGRLNDEFLVQKNLSESDILNYFFSFNAGAILMTSLDWEQVRQQWFLRPTAEQIVQDPRFSQYRLARKYKTQPDQGYYIFIYLRQDLYAAWEGRPTSADWENQEPLSSRLD